MAFRYIYNVDYVDILNHFRLPQQDFLNPEKKPNRVLVSVSSRSQDRGKVKLTPQGKAYNSQETLVTCRTNNAVYRRTGSLYDERVEPEMRLSGFGRISWILFFANIIVPGLPSP